MALRYLVDDTSDILKAATNNDNLVAPPGNTAVAATVIAAAYDGVIYLGGTWDGTTYTPPAGQPTEYNSSTDIGSVQVATLKQIAVLEDLRAGVDRISFHFSDAVLSRAHDWIIYVSLGGIRHALTDTESFADRVKFQEQIASLPLNSDGNLLGFMTQVVATLKVPNNSTASWAQHDDLTANLELGDDSTIGLEDLTTLADEPSSADLVSKEWLDDIS